MMTHYKLPYDTEVDKDIHKWINKFHRTKKGEMVRHAIRYYMAILEEGETIKFPPNANNVSASVSHEEKEVKEEVEVVKGKVRDRVRPNLNPNALK